MTTEKAPTCAVCGGPEVDEAGYIWGCEFCPNVNPRPKSAPVETNIVQHIPRGDHA